jgi:hypothetical protein
MLDPDPDQMNKDPGQLNTIETLPVGPASCLLYGDTNSDLVDAREPVAYLLCTILVES